jgi:hypothetical protein
MTDVKFWLQAEFYDRLNALVEEAERSNLSRADIIDSLRLLADALDYKDPGLDGLGCARS